MILFFDTETTGLANMRLSAIDPSQPHIVQLGAILCDSDRRTMAEINLLICPDGYTIPDGAAKVHGFTTEIATTYGMNGRGVIKLFCALAFRSELIVAHNLAFDSMLLRAAIHRLGNCEDQLNILESKKTFCTMQATTQLCRLPGKYGDFKWPNLQEAHRHFFGKDFAGAHDAMADVRACRDVYYAIKDRQAKPADVAPTT